jgi:hypothetical protein
MVGSFVHAAAVLLIEPQNCFGCQFAPSLIVHSQCDDIDTLAWQIALAH